MELRNGQSWPTNFSKARLARGLMAGIDLSNARLDDCDLTQANLQNAVLRGTILTDAVMTMADLRNADWTNADMRGVRGLMLPTPALA
jgi:uncharacterized protein YjbI with pentapeptide repeats